VLPHTSLWAHFVRNEMRRTQCAAKRGAPGMARNRALFRAAKCADLHAIQRSWRHRLRRSASRSAQSLRD